MGSPPRQSWKLDNGDANAALIRLIDPPAKPKAEESFVRANNQLNGPTIHFGSPRSQEAHDALFRDLAGRHTAKPNRPPLPSNAAVNNAAMAAARSGGGGGGGRGSSTPNAVGGGGASGGGGGGAGGAKGNWNVLSSNQASLASNTVTSGTHDANPTTSTESSAGQNLSPQYFDTPTHAPTSFNRPVTFSPPQTPQTTLSHPSHPSHPPHGHQQSGGDPLYVLDQNTGETIPANVPLNTFSTWDENLLAQVSGDTNVSYSWDTSQAPDLTNISGQNTANLQGTWTNFTGSARTNTIIITETPQGGSPLSQTITFQVAGTDSPGYSATRPTSNSTWQSVVTPDKISNGQATQAGGPYANLGLADGSVQTSFAMPSYNPNVSPLSLDYNSTTANAKPIFLAYYQLPTNQAVPSTITASLTLNNGTPVQTVYNTSTMNPGDIVQIALQGEATSLSSGRYPWQITVTNGSTPTTYSGDVDIINQANSPYGAGWSLDNVEQLLPVAGGVILVQPGGTSLWFASNGQGGFTSPAGDFSTLAKNADGSYTRTLTDGTQINFNNSGQQTSTVDRDGNTTTFAYTSGLLTGITDMNGQTTTLAYNAANQLATITDPANRKATLTYTGNQLTSITDPAGDEWQYAYDTANDLTTLTDPNNHATTFTYNFADRVSGVTLADGSTEALTAEQMNGLAAPGSGTASNPASAVLMAAGDQAQYTDGNSNIWLTNLDRLGYGLGIANIDPLGDASLNYIDSNGLTWLSADALGRASHDFFDDKGNTTEEVAPDDTTQQYQYNNFSEVTQYTDQEDDITKYSYNTKGDLTQTTDALNDITSYAYNTAGLVTSTTDPDGNITDYAYNALNELTSTTNALGDVTSYTYDTAGNQISTTNALGYTTTFTYDAMDRMTGQTLPDTPGVFSTYSYTYDKVGNQLSATDPLDHTTSYAYNAVNEQTSATDPLGNTTTYGYDANGNQISDTDPLGNATTYGYDAANQQISMTDPLGDQTSYSYDAAGEQTSVTAPMSNQTDYTYTPNGQVASKSVYDDNLVLDQQYNYSYDADGNPISTAAINTNLDGGSLSANISDSLSGNYTSTLGGSLSGNFSGSFSGSVVNSNNQVVGSISGDFNGTVSGSISDSGVLSGGFTGSGMATLSNGLSGSAPISIASSYFYGNNNGGSGGISGNNYLTLSCNVNNLGNIGGNLGGALSITFSGGGGGTTAGSGGLDGGPASGYAGPTTVTTYNPVGEPIQVTDPLGNTTTTTYDPGGNVTSVTDPNGNTTTTTYNPINEPVSVTNQTCGCAGMSGTTTYDYNVAGEQTKITDPQGNATSFTYDAQGRELSETAPNGGVTSYTYDAAGNQTSETDPDNYTTSYSYNADNQLLGTTNPQGHASTNAYNAAGLLTATTDADGRTIDYTYNAAGQKTSATWLGGNYTATYAYNADGELTSASDPFSSYAYTYNALGQETSVDNTGTPGVPQVTLSYAYDNFGNRISLSDSLGGSISYGYDLDNRMTSLGLSVSSTVYAQATLAYDGASNVTGMTRTTPSAGGDPIVTTYSYNHSNELTNIADVDATSGLTLANYTYGYNKAGVLTSYQDNSGNSLSYTYDANNELTGAAGSLAGKSYTFTYNYDPNGNRTSTSTDVNGTTTSATYSTATGNELSSDGTYDYTYDNDGNTLTQTNIATGSVTYYTWDYENRLTEEKQEDNQGHVLNDETFTYDVLGNRIGVSLNGVQQLYTVYDGSNPYMDFDGSGSLTERYVMNPNGLNQFYGEMNGSGTTEWFLTDNLGSIRQVISAGGSSLDAITYDPYGNILNQTNSANSPRLLYTGAAYDPIADTYLDGAREDNPLDGRWDNPDPLGFEGGDSNLYRYAYNDPTTDTDSSGLQAAGPLVESASLKLKVVEKANMVGARTGEMKVKWVPQGVKKGGFIIQHVKVYREYRKQPGGNLIQETVANYWEAWQVDAKGVVYGGYMKWKLVPKNFHDVFKQTIPPPNSCGLEDVVGYARYTEKYKVNWPGGPFGGGIKAAATLPSTEQMPAGWMDKDAIKHGFGIVWNDFTGIKPHIVVSWP